MRKLLNQFIILTITFWIASPLVDLFVINKAISGIEDYINYILIAKSALFGLVFTVVMNLIVFHYFIVDKSVLAY